MLGCALVVVETAGPGAQQLAPTPHPSIARDPDSLWLVPSDSTRAVAAVNPGFARLQSGITLYSQGNYEQALAQFSAAASVRSELLSYATYYAALTELRMERFEAARRRFDALKDSHPVGYLSQGAALGEAEAAEALHDYDDAAGIYEDVLKGKPIGEDGIWLNLAVAAVADQDNARAAKAYLQLYYEFPLSSLAAEAEVPLARLPEVQPIRPGSARYKFELGRAERLFGSRRYADARTSFLRVKPHAPKDDPKNDDAELIALRLAECDYFTSRYRASLDALRPYLDKASRKAEARFFYLMGQRGLKANETFVRLVRELVRDFPDSTWAEEALNNLASYNIILDQDDAADLVLRDMYARFPHGRYAERAAWKIGWRAYRLDQFSDTAKTFEGAAAAFPRSDYRPSFLYWAARAREAIGERGAAALRYSLVITDYQNSYYGRLAAAALTESTAGNGLQTVPLQPSRSAATAREEDESFQPPNADTIRSLLALDLYDEALNELRFAQRNWADAPILRATIAWAQQQKGKALTGTERFNLVRGGITMMRQAYPQFMAAGGERLPRDMLAVIFPIAYWDLIQQYAAQHDLDPYLMVALVAQESTFVPEIRSFANAYGLMQLLPSTARQQARRLKLTYSTQLLTTPEANIRMGMSYFADKMKEFGDAHLALASYNAGERAVRGWIAERPGVPRDEFIDDIPYPETQNYVKRILGTADDYRRLYGSK